MAIFNCYVSSPEGKAPLYTGFSSGSRPRIIRQPIFFGEAPRAFHPAPTTAAGVRCRFFEPGTRWERSNLMVTDIPSFKGYYGEPPTSYAGFMMVIYSILAAFYYFIGLPFAYRTIPKKNPNPAGTNSPYNTWGSSSFTFWQIVIPSGELTKSYGKWWFIVDFPIKNGDVPLLC